MRARIARRKDARSTPRHFGAAVRRIRSRQSLSTRRRKFAQLQRFYPDAIPSDWHLVAAGQRAQLVKPDPGKVGVLTFGTELVAGAGGTVAGLLGASPGASTAPAIMVDLLEQCFPERRSAWESVLRKLMPDLAAPVQG